MSADAFAAAVASQLDLLRNGLVSEHRRCLEEALAKHEPPELPRLRAQNGDLLKEVAELRSQVAELQGDLHLKDFADPKELVALRESNGRLLDAVEGLSRKNQELEVLTEKMRQEVSGGLQELPRASFLEDLVSRCVREQLSTAMVATKVNGEAAAAEKARKATAEEARKAAEEAREAELAREEEAARQAAEASRLAEEVKRKEEEARRKAEEEQRRKVEEARRKEEEERKRREEEKRRAEEVEEARRAEEARRQVAKEEERRAEEEEARSRAEAAEEAEAKRREAQERLRAAAAEASAAGAGPSAVELALEFYTKMAPSIPDQSCEGGPLWIVVGGSDTGGILVRQSKSVQSPGYQTRLATGAKVEELEVQGKRLHYKRIRGDGPDFGWVSIEGVGGKKLMEPWPESAD